MFRSLICLFFCLFYTGVLMHLCPGFECYVAGRYYIYSVDTYLWHVLDSDLALEACWQVFILLYLDELLLIDWHVPNRVGGETTPHEGRIICASTSLNPVSSIL